LDSLQVVKLMDIPEEGIGDWKQLRGKGIEKK
jgi:hypothetical protein